MPLTQVVKNEETGKKELQVVPGFSGGAGGGDSSAALAAAQEAKALAEAAKTTADKGVADAAAAQETADGKVSKTGDTMTGPLVIDTTESGSIYPLNIKVSNNFHSIMQNMDLDALEDPAVVIANNNSYRDKEGRIIGYLQQYTDTRGTNNTRIMAIGFDANENGKTYSSEIRAVAQRDGTRYATCFPPRETVNENDIDTRAASVARHPKKNTNTVTLHLGGDNASDTDSLHVDRGLTADKPFATLNGVWAYAINNFTGADIIILIHGEVVWSATNSLYQYGPSSITLMGADSNAVFKLQKDLILLQGITTLRSLNIDIDTHRIQCDGNWGHNHLNVSTVTFTGSNPISFLRAISDSFIWFYGNNTFNGTVGVATVAAELGATIEVFTAANLTGSVTGKRYFATNGSRIIVAGKGVNVFPGSEAGTVDSSSIYS